MIFRILYDTICLKGSERMHIGDRIKEKRLELDLSQEELAQKMGYKSKSTINKIEMGINDISQSKVVAFAKVLGTTPTALMGWDEPISLEPDEMQTERLAHYYVNTETARLADEIKDNPDLKVLFDASKNLTPENIKFVIEMINKMKGDD